MQITRDEDAGTITWSTANAETAALLARLGENLTPGAHLDYHGRTTDPSDANALRLHFKAGDVELNLVGTDVRDKNLIGSIRDICFYGSGLTYVGAGEVASGLSLIFTCGTCKLCGRQVATYRAATSEVCDTCAEQCEHVFEESMGQSQGRPAMLPFCLKCRVADPEWQPDADPMVDMARVVSDGPVTMLFIEHGDGTGTMIKKK